MNMNSSNPDLNGLIRYLNYHGPVIIRISSDLDPHHQKTVSLATTPEIS
ncbi:MAG: hypothetical protein JSW11_09315 [Candidatus Heimdallarchaeota archaeon]|nr:MAG: hypothetical protein JSW11_09315 [Candidatus Heimdallarchaeota archaeon]